jgi:hypothetical protein
VRSRQGQRHADEEQQLEREKQQLQQAYGHAWHDKQEASSNAASEASRMRESGLNACV